MTRAISLRDVTKIYPRDVVAVNRLSLDISPGEFVVLLGPSGCGKTTVLRMIAGLEDITSGELLLDGELANAVPPGERQLAMVFQHYALYPNMTGQQNISFPLKIESPGRDTTNQVRETARLLGIEDLLDRLPAQLSGGERQRVAMGRAIVRRPSAFLLDEPLSNLDAKLRTRLRAEIATLTRHLGVTTVYVTHDQAEAMSLGDRVAVMRDGVIQQIGPAREVYQRPENVFVAAFVGTPRINLLRAAVHAPLDGRLNIDFGTQRIQLPQPLSPDHQMLRVQMGREITVGLRSEAARIASPQEMRPTEALLNGVVQHVEFQGHESLVHVSTGAHPARVEGLEAPRPPAARRARGQRAGRKAPLRRLVGRYLSRSEGAERPEAERRNEPPGAAPPPPTAAGRITDGLVVRTSADAQPRLGERVPLLIDLDQMYVFDEEGQRICPAPPRRPSFSR
ncbi:ATP-binding cassette domain-containing protein [Streptomyces sp. 3MP-14]|uniref:ATP-binding cassette domain-containing protein n=1 Tax=Streptomyces mimosae TaxID=2586635 RepID=A0A5N5ZYQ3_9ACTN|nr:MULTISPECIES: ABC transporter ATP-binding protein [Streptomyces]KAB8161614.1 ATP-binding cassette domain-containing protein [Streptomyces mimosae]KAB8173449.1 ATP-binding cassette domain-containing protein [Streptomyces sp. 3MP-14]